MYVSFSVENMVTVGIMLLLLITACHLLAQAGVHLASWLPGQ